MLVGRVIQGAAGGIFPLAFGIIRDEFPRERVAGGIGLMSALLGVGGGRGVVLAGPIVDNLSYHYLFWLPLIPIVAGDGAHAPLRAGVAGAGARARSTGSAAALMSLGLVLVLVAVSETATLALAVGEDARLHRGRARRCSRSGCGCESRSRQPLVDMRMMRIRGVWTTNLVALLLGFGMYASFILLPQFVETPTATGTASARR